MTKCTAAASLVIRLYSETFQHIADRDDYLIRFSVLGEARIDADYAVRAGLIDAGNYLSVSRRGKRRLNLVAVMIRFSHADYRLDMGEFAEQFFHLALFEFPRSSDSAAGIRRIFYIEDTSFLQSCLIPFQSGYLRKFTYLSC